MATKSEIIASINGFLTAIITQAKVRSAALATVNELYADKVSDDQASQTYTTKFGTDFNYSVQIHKSGNTAHIKGTITNNTLTAKTDATIFNWKTNVYQPKAGFDDSVNFQAFGESESVGVYLSSSYMALTGVISAGGVVTFDYKFYITKD